MFIAVFSFSRGRKPPVSVCVLRASALGY
jgi:hypothetical protein